MANRFRSGDSCAARAPWRRFLVHEPHRSRRDPDPGGTRSRRRIRVLAEGHFDSDAHLRAGGFRSQHGHGLRRPDLDGPSSLHGRGCLHCRHCLRPFRSSHPPRVALRRRAFRTDRRDRRHALSSDQRALPDGRHAGGTVHHHLGPPTDSVDRYGVLRDAQHASGADRNLEPRHHDRPVLPRPAGRPAAHALRPQPGDQPDRAGMDGAARP